jgi:hypothetical protein
VVTPIRDLNPVNIQVSGVINTERNNIIAETTAIIPTESKISSSNSILQQDTAVVTNDHQDIGESQMTSESNNNNNKKTYADVTSSVSTTTTISQHTSNTPKSKLTKPGFQEPTGKTLSSQELSNSKQKVIDSQKLIDHTSVKKDISSLLHYNKDTTTTSNNNNKNNNKNETRSTVATSVPNIIAPNVVPTN